MSGISCALVTGANGFIGSNLCAALRDEGVVVRGLVLPGTQTADLVALGVDVVEADIGRPLDVNLFAGVSHVFHLAAIAFDWGSRELFQRVNVDGTRHVFEAARVAGVTHAVHMSSLAVHPYTGYSNGDEQAVRGWDINAYTITKNLAEDIAQSFRGDMQVTIIRPGVVPYGPGDRLSMPGILDALDRGIYAHVGGGSTRVCISYVGNLARGMILAAKRDGASGEVFVLADEVVTWREFVDAIADTFGRPRATRSIPFWLANSVAAITEKTWKLLPLRGTPPLTRYRIALFRGDLVFSSAKARQHFGFRPTVMLVEGLKHTQAWLDRNPAN